MEDIGNGNSFAGNAGGTVNVNSPGDSILDIREYDLPYYLRVAIDKGKHSVIFEFLVTDLVD